MNNWYKNRTVAALVLLLVLLLGGWLVMRGGDNDGEIKENESSEVAEVKTGEIKVEGVIACLPNSGTGENCVKGVKGDDNKMYALNIFTDLKIGAKVTAYGKYEPATKNAEAGTFQYDGVLDVRTLLPR